MRGDGTKNSKNILKSRRIFLKKKRKKKLVLDDQISEANKKFVHFKKFEGQNACKKSILLVICFNKNDEEFIFFVGH